MNLNELPEDVQARLKARLACTLNADRIVWVERAACGHWLVHASTPHMAKRKMNAALQAGLFFATADELLKG